MLAVLVTLTPGHRKVFIDGQKAKFHIALPPIMDVQTRCNFTLKLLEGACQLWEFTHEWLRNSKYCDYRWLFTTQEEWTIVKIVRDVLRPFRYWTLWMSNRHTVTLHHIMTVYNDMFVHIDGVKRALSKKMTQWKEDLIFTMKLAWKKLRECYTVVIPMMGMHHISAHILDLFQKLRSFTKWDNGMNTNLDDEIFYTN